MDRLYNYAESAIVNFKLEYCCWVAPVRIGIYIIAYFYLLTDFVSLVATANESFSPMLMKIQEIIIEDYVSKPIPVLAYSTEMCFTVILLCGMYRKDPVLLRVYIFYNMAAVVMAILVYSMVIAAFDVLISFVIIFNIVLQIYMCILVWSAMVEVRDAPSKNGNVLVAYNVEDQEVEISAKPASIAADVEAPAESPAETIHQEEAAPTDSKGHRDTKLETVNEDPKES